MKCIESRPTSDGYRRRRYRREDGVVIVTIEVPMAVWKTINRQGRAHDRTAQFYRAREREALHKKVLEHAEEGWKAIASAHELGVPVRTVQRWRAAAVQMISA